MDDGGRESDEQHDGKDDPSKSLPALGHLLERELGVVCAEQESACASFLRPFELSRNNVQTPLTPTGPNLQNHRESAEPSRISLESRVRRTGCSPSSEERLLPIRQRRRDRPKCHHPRQTAKDEDADDEHDQFPWREHVGAVLAPRDQGAEVDENGGVENRVDDCVERVSDGSQRTLISSSNLNRDSPSWNESSSCSTRTKSNHVNELPAIKHANTSSLPSTPTMPSVANVKPKP